MSCTRPGLSLTKGTFSSRRNTYTNTRFSTPRRDLSLLSQENTTLARHRGSHQSGISAHQRGITSWRDFAHPGGMFSPKRDHTKARFFALEPRTCQIGHQIGNLISTNQNLAILQSDIHRSPTHLHRLLHTPMSPDVRDI